MNISFEAY